MANNVRRVTPLRHNVKQYKQATDTFEYLRYKLVEGTGWAIMGRNKRFLELEQNGHPATRFIADQMVEYGWIEDQFALWLAACETLDGSYITVGANNGTVPRALRYVARTIDRASRLTVGANTSIGWFLVALGEWLSKRTPGYIVTLSLASTQGNRPTIAIYVTAAPPEDDTKE